MTKPGGESTRPSVTIFEDAGPSLEQAQKLVDGWVEMVTLANGDQLLVNEEGLMHNLQMNARASRLAGRLIVGNALVLKGDARWK